MLDWEVDGMGRERDTIVKTRQVIKKVRRDVCWEERKLGLKSVCVWNY
jgi:hypothetical protein